MYRGWLKCFMCLRTFYSDNEACPWCYTRTGRPVSDAERRRLSGQKPAVDEGSSSPKVGSKVKEIQRLVCDVPVDEVMRRAFTICEEINSIETSASIGLIAGVSASGEIVSITVGGFPVWDTEDNNSRFTERDSDDPVELDEIRAHVRRELESVSCCLLGLIADFPAPSEGTSTEDLNGKD